MYRRILALMIVMLALGQLAAQDTWEGHTEPVTDLAFNIDGTLLVSGGDDISLRLWRVEDGEHLIALYPHNNVVKGVDFTPDGLLVSTSWDRSVNLHEFMGEEAELTETLRGYDAVIEKVAVSPDHLAFGVGDGTIPLLDIDTLETIHTYTLDSLQITALAFSTDAQYLAAASGFPEDRIYLWSVDDEEPIRDFTGHSNGITGLVFHSEVMMLASIGTDGRFALWDVSEDGYVMQIGGMTLEEDLWLTSIAFHPEEPLLAIGDLDGNITLWDVSQPDGPELVDEMQAHDGPVNALDFNPDGTLLASGGDDGLIRLWEV